MGWRNQLVAVNVKAQHRSEFTWRDSADAPINAGRAEAVGAGQGREAPPAGGTP